MSLDRDFAGKFLNAVNARQLKAQAILKGVEDFMLYAIESHKNDPVAIHEEPDSELRFEQVGGASGYYADLMYVQSHERFSTVSRLTVTVKDSGIVQTSAEEFPQAPNYFIFDNYTVEEAVAKIMTSIAASRGDYFSTLVKTAMERLAKDQATPSPAQPALDV